MKESLWNHLFEVKIRNSLESIGVHWNSLKSIEIHCNSLEFIEIHWNSLEFTNSLEFIEIHWNSLELIGIQSALLRSKFAEFASTAPSPIGVSLFGVPKVPQVLQSALRAQKYTLGPENHRFDLGKRRSDCTWVIRERESTPN